MAGPPPLLWEDLATDERHTLVVQRIDIELLEENGEPVVNHPCVIDGAGEWKAEAVTNSIGKVCLATPESDGELTVSFTQLEGVFKNEGASESDDADESSSASPSPGTNPEPDEPVVSDEPHGLLREGSSGPEVNQWQNYLLGRSHYLDNIVDGGFGKKTTVAVKSFQKAHGLNPVDGIIGNDTWGKAEQNGLVIYKTKATGTQAGSLKPLSLSDRKKLFGCFEHTPCGDSINAEAITITSSDEAYRIVQVTVPQLAGVYGAPSNGSVPFHGKVAQQLVAMFQAWEDAGHKSLVKSWAGSLSRRYIRGSRTTLSNHSWGTAFDINAAWNPLGSTPAQEGSEGSVRELVAIAEEHGFYWGGFFSSRPDGMHFEAAKVL